MRKLIVRAFNVSLDGVSADYGTDYFEWCMSGIDPRVSDVGKYGPLNLVSSRTLSNGTLELEYRRDR